MKHVGNLDGLKRTQRGATFLGMLIIISILLFAVYGGIRLTPLYMEYMDLSRVLTQAATTLNPNASPAEIRESLQQRWVIDDIKSVKPKDIIINRSARGTTLQAQYRAEAPFISNISLVVDFDKTVTMGGAEIP